MHLMRECWNAFSIGYILPKRSLLTPVFSRKLQQLREAGMQEKWIKDEMDRVAR